MQIEGFVYYVSAIMDSSLLNIQEEGKSALLAYCFPLFFTQSYSRNK